MIKKAQINKLYIYISVLVVLFSILGVAALFVEASDNSQGSESYYSDDSSQSLIGKAYTRITGKESYDALVNAENAKQDMVSSAEISTEYRTIIPKRKVSYDQMPCMDSDNGKNYYEKGKTNGYVLKSSGGIVEQHFIPEYLKDKEDTCYMGQLKEYYCDNQLLKVELFDCKSLGSFFCFQGACIPECSTIQESCNCEDDNCDSIVDGTDMGNGKIDPACITNEQCGTCDNACPINSHCQPNPFSLFGAECVCNPNFDTCSGTLCDTYLLDDEENCGACGNQCESYETCLNGKCVCKEYELTSELSFEEQISTLSDLWGFSENDVYAVGPKWRISHFDGKKWNEIKLPDSIISLLPKSKYPESFYYGFTDIWGINGNLFITGIALWNGNLNASAILHYDGNSWSVMKIEPMYPYNNDLSIAVIPEFNLIYGYAEDDVYAVSREAGYIYHFDGNVWSYTGHSFKDINASFGSYVGLGNSAIWGTPETGLYIAYNDDYYTDGHLFNYKDDVLSEIDFGKLDYSDIDWIDGYMDEVGGVFGFGDSLYLGVGWRNVKGFLMKKEGSSWKTEYSDSNQIPDQISGTSENDLYLWSINFCHYSDQKMECSKCQSGESGITSSGYFGPDSDDVWASPQGTAFAECSYGGICYHDGDECRRTYTNVAYPLSDAWSTSSSDIFALGHSGTIMHYNGQSWAKMETPFDWNDLSHEGNLHHIWGSSSDNVYALSDDTLLHYDGNSWKFESINVPLQDGTYYTNIWGLSDNNIYITLASKYAEKYYEEETPINGILHFNGAGWSMINIPEGIKLLSDIWGSSSDNIYAVGQNIDLNLAIIHYDGNSWSMVEAPQELPDWWDDYAYFNKIIGNAPNNMYIASSSKLYHFDGSSVTLVQDFSGMSTQPIQDIMLLGDGQLVVTGYLNSKGGIMMYNGESWSSIYLEELSENIHGLLAGTNNDFFALGGMYNPNYNPHALVRHFYYKCKTD